MGNCFSPCDRKVFVCPFGAVTDIIGCEETEIHIGDYPVLEDIQGLLKEAVEQILGIEITYLPK